MNNKVSELRDAIAQAELTNEELQEVAGGLLACREACTPGCMPGCVQGNATGSQT